MLVQVRHQGSAAVQSLQAEQVAQGLRDGQFDPQDEVKFPSETKWTELENHPTFAEIAEEVEPPMPKSHDQATHLDMNALIDVCLVLLIFFILTTSYAATVQKVVPLPDVKSESKSKRKLKPADVKNHMIKVQASLGADGKPAVTVENLKVDVAKDDDIDRAKLADILRGYVRSSEKRTDLLLSAGDIRWETFIAIQDAAKAAGVHTINLTKPGR